MSHGPCGLAGGAASAAVGVMAVATPIIATRGASVARTGCARLCPEEFIDTDRPPFVVALIPRCPSAPALPGWRWGFRLSIVEALTPTAVKLAGFFGSGGLTGDPLGQSVRHPRGSAGATATIARGTCRVKGHRVPATGGPEWA